MSIACERSAPTSSSPHQTPRQGRGCVRGSRAFRLRSSWPPSASACCPRPSSSPGSTRDSRCSSGRNATCPSGTGRSARQSTGVTRRSVRKSVGRSPGFRCFAVGGRSRKRKRSARRPKPRTCWSGYAKSRSSTFTTAPRCGVLECSRRFASLRSNASIRVSETNCTGITRGSSSNSPSLRTSTSLAPSRRPGTTVSTRSTTMCARRSTGPSVTAMS